MFGNKSKEDSTKMTTTTTGSNPNALNSLVKGTVVEGTVTSESDLRVDGIIKGILVCNAKVIIGPTGSVIGDIKCVNAIIEGHFEGKLRVSELLNVRETAEVKGDILTNKLIVQAGASFNVVCDMGNDPLGQKKDSHNSFSKANGNASHAEVGQLKKVAN